MRSTRPLQYLCPFCAKLGELVAYGNTILAVNFRNKNNSEFRISNSELKITH